MIDRVRVDEANRLRHDKPARKVIKEARWLLLRNPQNWKTPKQQVRLEDLLAANQALMTVYLMKAELKTLWTPSTACGWRSAIEAMAAPCARKRNTSSGPARQMAKGLLAGHREPGSLADAYGPIGRNKQSTKSHQADGLRLPG